MSSLYFVNHPINEPKYSTKGIQIIPWNCGTHKRKLIRHDGIYLKSIDGPIDYAPLYFWGEYEPYSCAHVQKDHRPAIHDDLKSARNTNATPIANMANTDPYVFGSRFRYFCCMKPKKSTLMPDDIVLFGHYGGCGSNNQIVFHFDTVFVCKQDGVAAPSPNFENQYYQVGILEQGNQKYAEGSMYKDGGRYFCFVPCLVGDWSSEDVDFSKGFPYDKLPYLDLKKYNIDKINPRTRHCLEFKSSMWDDIIDATKIAGMSFGVHLAEI